MNSNMIIDLFLFKHIGPLLSLPTAAFPIHSLVLISFKFLNPRNFMILWRNFAIDRAEFIFSRTYVS